MGITEKTVEYHISKALKALRVSLKDYLPLIAVFLGPVTAFSDKFS